MVGEQLNIHGSSSMVGEQLNIHGSSSTWWPDEVAW
jgi:hypothetical protein